MTTVKLVDLNTNERYQPVGSEYRTLQVFRCWVCSSLTNKAYSVPMYKVSMPKTVCPNAAEGWHKQLRGKMKLRKEFHPPGYKLELEYDISQIKRENAHLFKNDIVGFPDLKQEESVDITLVDPNAKPWDSGAIRSTE